MNRVLIAHPSADVYGSDRQLLESIDALRAAGWEVTVCLPAGGPLVGLLADARVHIASFPVLQKSLLRPASLLGMALRTPRDLFRLLRRLRSVRPDVVYVNTVTIPWWILAARLARVPVLVHVHEAEEDVPRVVAIGLAAPLLLAHTIVANSAASARVLTDAIARLAQRTVVVPNGVPDRGAAPVEAARPDRLAVVARLSPRKGIDVALEALALLRGQGRDVELDVCGTTYPGYEWFEQQLRERSAAPDLRGAVHFVGYRNPTTPILAGAAVVLVPSRSEPFGNTAVEALLAQRPLVASRVQGLTEIVEDGRTGLLVPPGDAPALAEAIARLLDDEALAEGLAAAGRRDAVARFALGTYHETVVGIVEATHR